MKKSEYKFIFGAFFLWLLLIFVIIFFAQYTLPLGEHFLGGGRENYLNNPYLWSLGNFDGEHYLAIARDGYKPLTYFFFPLYPIVTAFFGAAQLSGVLVSIFAFVLGLFGFYKVARLGFSEKVSKLALVFLLLFPTSFFFVSVYTESLFFCLIVWSFYFFKKEKFIFAGILGLLASATRLVGVVLLPIYLFDIYTKKKKISYSTFWIGVIPLGLISYMMYLHFVTGDSLNFFNNVGIFGEQRSASFTLFPQVFYRYVFKILPALSSQSFIWQFPAIMELFIALIVFSSSVILFIRKQYDYAFYTFLGFLVPSFSGSFSSFPRYALVLFPIFYFFSELLVKSKLKYLTLLISAILLIICEMMFVRGYWIS